jgi:ABC-type Zn uptake system ZnuABC Zn-binding protein ZnuA
MVAGMVLGLGVISALWLGGCSRALDPWQDEAGPPRVVVTIPPLYSFVKAVAGERAGVKCLCTTKGVHHFEFDPRDTLLLRGANLFLAIGLTLDDRFADKLDARSQNPDLRYVKLGEKLPEKLLRKLPHAIRHGDHVHHGHDPHVWLGIEQTVALVGIIRDELVKADKGHAAEYRKNAAAYVGRLKKLQKEGRKMLQGKNNQRIITFHDSLRYFATGFGLEIADVIELGPGDEPSPTHLAKLVKLCREEPVGAIAAEPQFAEGSAGRLRDELKSKGVEVALIKIDPLETAEAGPLQEQADRWYEGRMRANLKALADGLP